MNKNLILMILRLKCIYVKCVHNFYHSRLCKYESQERYLQINVHLF